MQNTEAALESLSKLLTSLTESPYSLQLHAKHIQLTTHPDLADQFEGAAQLLTQFYAATDQVWLPYLQAKLRHLGIPDDFESAEEVTLDLSGVTLEALLEVMELFRKAAGDCLSIPILAKEIKFIILMHSFASTNPALEPLLSEDAVRSAIAAAALQGSWHITKSQELWDLQINWEKARLEEKDPSSPEREVLKSHIETLHLERLKQTHSENEQTLQSYSSLVSSYFDPGEYEDRLVTASQLRTAPAKAWSFKERHEAHLDSSLTKDAYQSYIFSEGKVKVPNHTLINALYERAIADFASRRWQALVDNADAEKVKELEQTLRYFWCEYVDSLRQRGNGELELAVIRRATRSIPGCGEIWAKYIRALERRGNDEEGEEDEDEDEEMEGKKSEGISDVFTTALSTSLLQEEVQELILVFLAKASYERRQMLEYDCEYTVICDTIEQGITMVQSASKEGDPQLTLETFLSRFFMSFEEPDVSEVIELWESTVASKQYRNSYLAWSKYIDFLISQKDCQYKVNAVFQEALSKPLDWPEPLLQKWKEWVYFQGSVEEIESCLDKIKEISGKLERKRAREAAKAQQAWMEANQQYVQVEAVQPVVESANEAQSEPRMVDIMESQGGDKKRKAEDEKEPDSVKRPKLVEDTDHLKRDRENSTVFVSGLPSGTTDDDLVSLFKDCGKIREVKITKLAQSLVATVEFMSRDNIPAALTKDKKRIHGEEIGVHLAWKSTLYVTNFPESTDDTKIRELFGQFGEIFEVRWPSKKYKSTRRFCYIQYTSPNAATEALSLHGKEMEAGRTLTVYISNPQRKQERSDASADDRELYVAGLPKSVSEADIRKLFGSYGTINAIRIPTDDKGSPKGFAFVEFEDTGSANAALAVNNQEFKKRRISVTVADKRAQPRAGPPNAQARRSRTLRIRNLPPDTQEGLLQQVLEKHAKVVRLEVFAKKHEAVVELSSPVEAGNLLLKPEPIIFGDQELKFIEEDLPASSRESVQSSLAFAPRASGRPRAGLGSKKKGFDLNNKGTTAVAVKPSASTSSGTGSAGEKGQDDFRRMLGGGS